MKSIKYSVILIFILISSISWGQAPFKNDEDMLKYANKIFEQGKYKEAQPLFLQLLSNNLKEPDYNFKYGTCLLFNSEDKQESIKHLYFASTHNGDSRSYFFLGKAYHYNYQFVNALKNYNSFDAKGEETYKKEYKLDLHINQCKNGNKLLGNLTELIVDEKTETKIDNFPYSYDLEQMNGRILISEEFQSKLDKKKGYRSMSFFPSMSSSQNVIFYSSYGKDGSTGLDLYSRKRLPNGEWGEEQKLPEHINSKYDDGYGFLHSSGTVFYFCSEGHNSMGGYDVFKCSYDITTNKFGAPINLDYKINTPDDDIMYVVDEEEKNAYFASTRASPGGYIDVYKVRVKSIPIVNVFLSGTFDNQLYEDDVATIKVQDTRNNEIISVTQPDKSGKYMIILPKGGTYNFIVQTKKSSQVHTEKVVVEAPEEFRPLKQIIELVELGNQEKVEIKNLFDEIIDDPELRAKALKMMADQDVNADGLEEEIANRDSALAETLDPSINVTTEDLITSFKEGAENIQSVADEAKSKMEGAYFVADVKLKLADEKAREAQEILGSLISIEDPDERNSEAARANQLNKESKLYYNQGQTAIKLGDSNKAKYEESQKLADEAMADALAIENNINNIDQAGASEKIKAMQGKIEKILKGSTEVSSADDELVIQAKETKDRANSKFEEGKSFRKDQEDLILRKKRLEADMEKAKSKDKESYQIQIDEVNEQITQSGNWAEEAYAEAEKLDKIAASLGQQVTLTGNLNDEITAGAETPLSDEEKQILFDFSKNNTIEADIADNREVLLKYIPQDDVDTGLAFVNGGTEGETEVATAEGIEGEGETEVTTTEGTEGDGETEVTTAEGTEGEGEAEVTTTEGTEGEGEAEVTTTEGTEGEGEAEVTTTEGTEGEGETEVTTTEGTEGETEVTITEGAEGEEYTFESTIEAQTNLSAIDQSVGLNDVRERFGNDDPKGLAEAENEILEDWVNDLNEEVQNVNANILATSGDEKDELKRLRKEIIDKRNGFEREILSNEEILSQTSSIVITDTSSDELIEVVSQTNEDVASAEDYSSDLTEVGLYRSNEADEIISKTQETRDEVNIKRQEIEGLEDEYENEKKEKKRDKKQLEIVEAEGELRDLEIGLGTDYVEMDTKELEYNDEELNSLIENVQANVPGYRTDKNYIAATIFSENADALRFEADALIEQASQTISIDDKNSLLKQAHQKNQAAAENQRSSISALDDMDIDGYVAQSIPLSNDKSLTIEGTEGEGESEVATTEGTEGEGETEVTTTEGTEGEGETEVTATEGTEGEGETEVTTTEGTEGEGESEVTTTEGTEGEGETEVTTIEGTEGEGETEVTTTEGTEGEGETEVTTTEGTKGEGESEVTTTEGTEGEGETEVTTTEGTEGEIVSNPTRTNSVNPTDVTNGSQTIEKATDIANGNGIDKVSPQSEGDKDFDPKENQPETYEVSLEAVEMEYSNNPDFEATSAAEILDNEQKGIDKVAALNVDKEGLNSEATATSDPKQQAKIEKKENAIDKKIDKEEIKLDEAFQQVNAAGIEIAKGNLDQVRISFGNLEMDDNFNLNQASEYENKGDELISESESLRGQAENEKDKSVKNELLKQANSNDLKAIEYYNNAADLYQKGAIENIDTAIEAGDLDKYSSEELIDLSNRVKSQAANLTTASIDARDSSLTAKGDDKIDMINRSDANAKKAASLNSIGNNLQLLAAQASDIESEIERNNKLKEGLTSTDVAVVRSNPAYEEFYNNQSKIDADKIKQAELEGEKKGYENLVKQQEASINDLIQQKADTESQSEKSNIDDQIDAIDDLLDQNEEKIDELNVEIESLDESIGNQTRNNEDLISGLDPELQDDFNALAISAIDKMPTAVPAITELEIAITPENLVSADFVAPTQLTKSIALIDDNIKYDDSNPIPLNAKNPDGLIYKVQVGAFSKPISNDVFNGFAPITGEQVGRLIRYRVGYFVDFKSANDAKNEIRGLGYSDAFVVAIKDGERMNLSAARNEEREGAGNTDVAIATDPTIGTTEGETTTETTETTETAGAGTAETTETEGEGTTTETEGTVDIILETAEGEAETIDATKLEGLFYTVQLGAFSKPIEADNVFNMSPLVAKKINNLYKYSTGIYRTIDEANQRKREVVALGNSDAFVAVYYNGERITGAKARELIAEKGDAVYSSDVNGNLNQLTGGNQTNLVPATEEGSFKVDLGTYQGEAPTFIANAMLTISAYKVNREVTPEGKHYFVGNFKNEKDAQAVVDLYKSNGVESVKIVDITP